MYKVLIAERCSGGDTQKPTASFNGSLTSSLQAANQNPSKKTPPSSSVSLLYPVVNKEAEQQFSGRVNNLGKTVVLDPVLCSSAAGAVPNSACH
jgi:hypothetical protein